MHLQTINESSPWLEKLRNEVKVFMTNKINVDQLIVQNREAERIRSQMVILERRVQVLSAYEDYNTNKYI